MRIYECENCHSVFIINETDERVKSGDYEIIGDVICALCQCDMFQIELKDKQEETKI